MDQGPLVSDLINAGKTFLQALDPALPVAAAFWVKEGERDDNYWNLYVVPEQLQETWGEDWKGALATASSILRGLPPNLWLDSSHVSIIGSDHHYASDVIERQTKYPTPSSGVRLGGPLGKGYALDGYLYPLLHTVTT